MANSICTKRLQIELVSLQKNPVENITATPHEKNILEWHYVIEGPKGSPYEGGFYHGVLKFPKEYPFKPPSIMMFTKNGRFKTNTRLCLSMSDYHPETWNPLWSVGSILSGLLSFMLDSAQTLGSIEMSLEQRKALAKRSLEENVKNPDFRALFPQYVEIHQQQKLKEASEPPKPSTATPNTQATAREKTEETSYLCVSMIVLIVAILAYLTVFSPDNFQ